MRFLSDPKIAVLGLFHKEAFFTPYYQSYYGGLFGNENIYILGDPVNDPFLSMFEKANLVDLGATYQSEYAVHIHMVQEMQKELLQKYDIVIFAEADEFIFADPDKYENLKDFLVQNKDDYLRVQGYNVIHDLDNERPIDPRKPLMSQRKYWYKHGGEQWGGQGGESKLLIVRKPVERHWPGFHKTDTWGVDYPEHPDLYNYHMHEFDFDICNSRVKARFDTILPYHSDMADPVIFWEGRLVDEKLKEYHRKKLAEKPVVLIPERFAKLNLV